MGPVSLPRAGRVYLDSASLIYSIERHPTFAVKLDPLWQGLAAGTLELLTSELAVMECLVLPMRRADETAQDDFERAFRDSGLQLVPVSRELLKAAAALRASHPRLRTPDAIHLATAASSAAEAVVTNDLGMKGIGTVPILLLSDL